jgi:hypothetical protein
MNDPKDIVKEYLAKSGYPLEMYVAKKFRSAGFEVYQSSTYVDGETGKERDVDVTAYYVRNIRNVQLSFKIIIECKHATTQWVLFTGENPGFADLKTESFYCTNHAGGELLKKLAITNSFEKKLPFRIQSNFGYGLTEVAKGKKQDGARTTYKAIMTLLNSLQHERKLERESRSFEIYIPVIVVQGDLFECYLNDRDEEVVNKISEGQLLYKHNVNPGVFPLIEVVTRETVVELANKLFTDLDSICSEYRDEVEFLIDNFASNFIIH